MIMNLKNNDKIIYMLLPIPYEILRIRYYRDFPGYPQGMRHIKTEFLKYRSGTIRERERETEKDKIFDILGKRFIRPLKDGRCCPIFKLINKGEL